MSSQYADEVAPEKSNVEIQMHGPKVMLLPIPTDDAIQIQRIVFRTNELLASHQDFLANLSDDDSPAPTSTTPSFTSLVTPPPLLNPRLASPQAISLPECNSISASASNAGSSSASSRFAISLSSVSSTASVTIASLNNQLGSAKASITVAISLGNAASMNASSSVSSASASASAASVSVQSMLQSAMSSASAAVSAASSSLASAMASASAAVSSANLAADQARASVTLQASQAQASIASINQQAQAMIQASSLAAMNNIRFALVVTFSVLGSSLATILIIYLCVRFRRRRTEKRQLALKEKIQLRRESDESDGPSLSEFPFPANRRTWSQRTVDRERDNKLERESREARMRQNDLVREDSLPAVMMPAVMMSAVGSPTMPNGKMDRKTWAATKAREEGRRASAEFMMEQERSRKTWSGQRERSATFSEGSSKGSRKTTLVYDADRPEDPPTFMTWLDDSMKSPRKILGEGKRERRERREEKERKKAAASITLAGGTRKENENFIGTAF